MKTSTKDSIRRVVVYGMVALWGYFLGDAVPSMPFGGIIASITMLAGFHLLVLMERG